MPTSPAHEQDDERPAVVCHDVTALVIPDGQVRGHIRQGSEYGPDGLLKAGPQRAVPCLARMMGDTTDAPPAPPPHIARIQQRARLADKRRILDRQARFLAAVAGQAVGRNRKAA